MQPRPGVAGFLPVAGSAFINPRACLQPPSLPPAAPGTDKSAGPAKLCQVLDAPLLVPNRAANSRSPAIRSPRYRLELCYRRARPTARTFREPALPRQGYKWVFLGRASTAGTIGTEAAGRKP